MSKTAADTRNFAVEQIDVNALKPYNRNSRTHSPEQINQIVASVREFGWTQPILINAENGIIAGHGRLMAAQQLEMLTVPAIRINGLTADQERALVIADNRLALSAGWDTQKLAEEMRALKEANFDIDVMGFSSKEVDELFAIFDDGKPEDDVPAAPATPVSQIGDVWLLGRHRVMCGDSTVQENMDALVDGRKVDLWITDPPYNVNYEGKTKDALKIDNDSMTNQMFRKFLVDSYRVADAVMRAGAVFYIWHSDSEGFNFRGAASDVGWKVRQCLIWNKSSMVMGRQDYQWKHEPCLYGWKDGAGHYWGTNRSQTTVLEFARPNRNAEHPTMKPLALFEYQITNSSKRGDLILDSFGGSGTTLIAADRLGRSAAIMEFDPRYVDVIIARWHILTGQSATLKNTGQIFEQVAVDRLNQ